MELKKILEVNFTRWFCVDCHLVWWLGNSYDKPPKCPFRGHPSSAIMRAHPDTTLLAQPAELLELPEDLSSDELANIFKIHTE